jgi:hypothetical protein
MGRRPRWNDCALYNRVGIADQRLRIQLLWPLDWLSLSATPVPETTHDSPVKSAPRQYLPEFPIHSRAETLAYGGLSPAGVPVRGCGAF